MTSIGFSPVARSRTHALPSSPLTPRLHVALRVRRGVFGTTSNTLYLGGTYAVTGSAPALAEENLLLFLRQRARHSINLVIITLIFSCAAFLWLLWLTERRRTELGWLGLVAASRGFAQMGFYRSMAPDGYVNNPFFWGLGAQAQFVSGAALAELILAFVGFRCAWWLRVLLWSCWLLPLNLNLEVPAFFYASLDLGALAILAFGRWRQRQPDPLTTIAVALVTLAHLNVHWRYFPSSIEWNGYDINLSSGSLAVLSSLLVVLSLRSLTADRRERQRLASELEAARTVQQLLLPLAEARSGAFEASAVYEPAQEVGGDFHWNRVTPDGALIAVVGDVSGKGLKAAMLVSVVIGILRTVKESSPAAILQALNSGLAGHTGGGFVTACCARFDATGSVTLANAGHPSPYCEGREVAVEAGLPLGVVAGVAYEEFVVRGERFTFVSDGVVEAENSRRELFGFERTREISTKPAQEIADAAKAWGQNDDITVVTVTRRKTT